MRIFYSKLLAFKTYYFEVYSLDVVFPIRKSIRVTLVAIENSHRRIAPVRGGFGQASDATKTKQRPSQRKYHYVY